jgi:hypothetical protein
MTEILLGRNVLAEAGQVVFALPGMTTTLVRNGRAETQARVQVELTPQGAVRVRALENGPVAAELEAQASAAILAVLSSND